MLLSVQQNSEHHIAHGILRKLKEKNLPLWKVEDFQYMQGIGVSGTVSGRKVLSVGPNYFKQKNFALPVVPNAVNQNIETISFLLIDDAPTGIVTLADTIRETSNDAINQLRKLHIKSFFADWRQ